MINDNLSGNRNEVPLKKKVEAAFDVSVQDGCSPLKIRFRNMSTAFDSCRWIFGDGVHQLTGILNGFLILKVNTG